MKTLDEVIKALELCQQMTSRGDHCNECPYAKKDEFNDLTFDCNDSEVDALHYLKEYRDKMANDEEAYKRGYSCGYKKAKEDEAVSRSWDESYRASQMPWNHGCEMGG